MIRRSSFVFSRIVGVIACFLVAFGSALPASAAGEQPDESTYVAPLANPVLEARAKALQKELRCLVCQGQSIDESNAPLAADLRRLIRQQMVAGQSDQQIKDFLVARYGAFVLMRPPVRQDTLFLWFGPMLLVLAGLGVIGVIVVRSRQRLGPSDDLTTESP
ncbi:MAG TPA: cytochrome c-type biogenesis protein [Micropepsaceae bacterium]|nr:cytochrome c-type biogenesis protein [Micropepsaceae bacterium]